MLLGSNLSMTLRACHCGIDIPDFEFVSAMRFPQRDKVIVRHLNLRMRFDSGWPGAAHETA